MANDNEQQVGDQPDDNDQQGQADQSKNENIDNQEQPRQPATETQPKDAIKPEVTPLNRRKRNTFLLLVGLVLLSAIIYAFSVTSSDDMTDNEIDDSEAAQTTQPSSSDVIQVALDDQVVNVNDQFDLSSSGQEFNIIDELTYWHDGANGPVFVDWSDQANPEAYFLYGQQLTASIAGFLESPRSADGNLVAYFEQGQDYPTESYIMIDDTSDDVEPERLVEAWNQSHGPLVPIAWQDDQTILLKEHSCFECDGPLLPKVWKLDVGTQELVNIVDLTDDQVGSFTTKIYVHPELEGVVIVIGPPALGDLSYEQRLDVEEKVYFYDLADDETQLLFEKESSDQALGEVVGWDKENDRLLLTGFEIQEGEVEATGLPYGTKFNGLILIGLDGSTTNFPLQISYLDTVDGSPSGVVSQATTDGSNLYFVTVTPNFDRQAGSDNYNLRALPLIGEEVAVEIIASSSEPILLLGFETIEVR